MALKNNPVLIGNGFLFLHGKSIPHYCDWEFAPHCDHGWTEKHATESENVEAVISSLQVEQSRRG